MVAATDTRGKGEIPTGKKEAKRVVRYARNEEWAELQVPCFSSHLLSFHPVSLHRPYLGLGRGLCPGNSHISTCFLSYALAQLLYSAYNL